MLLNRYLNSLHATSWECTVCLGRIARTWRFGCKSKFKRRKLRLLRFLLPSFASFADEVEVVLLRLGFGNVVTFTVLPYVTSLTCEAVRTIILLSISSRHEHVMYMGHTKFSPYR